MREAAWERPISEERLLPGELAHKVNSDFAAVIGILSVAAARSPSEEVKVALAAVEERLHALTRKRTIASALEYVRPSAPSLQSRVRAHAFVRRHARGCSSDRQERARERGRRRRDQRRLAVR